MGNRYIYNRHIAPITANARDEKGRILFTKKFQPERVDGTTGRVISTGYTTLTDEEYKQLNEGSKTFAVYRDKHKLLVEHDELPPEAKTPQEALLDARNEARKSAAQIASLNEKIAALEAALSDAEQRYKDLFDASGGDAGSAKLIKELEAVRQSLKETAAAKDEVISRLTEEGGRLKTAAESALIERNAAITELKNVKKKLKEKEFD
jgi:chromosome segregation ATPase